MFKPIINRKELFATKAEMNLEKEKSSLDGFHTNIGILMNNNNLSN